MAGTFNDDDAAKAAAWMNEQARTRRNLNDKEMMRLVAPACELVHRIKLQGAAGYAWFYTLKGLLDHVMISGAFYRNAAAVVIAMDKREANQFAEEGLKTTLDELRAYWLENADEDKEMPGIVVEAGGRKSQGGPPLIYSNPALFEYLKNRFDVKGKKAN